MIDRRVHKKPHTLETCPVPGCGGMMHLRRGTYTCDRCKHFEQDISLQNIVESDDPASLRECKCPYCRNATIEFNHGSKPPTERQLREIVILKPMIARLWDIEQVYELGDDPASEYKLRSLLPQHRGGACCHIRGSDSTMSDRILEDILRRQLENLNMVRTGWV